MRAGRLHCVVQKTAAPAGTARKSQSAMEYLITYGWAILLISIVLVTLFKLGVLGSTGQVPYAQPGGCQVNRPNGPNTTYFIGLEGLCNGEMPKFVAQFQGTGSLTQQNGFAALESSTQPFSFSIWVYPSSSSGVIVDEYAGGVHDSWIELVGGTLYMRVWSLPCVGMGSLPTNKWSHIVMTGSVSGSALTYSGYVNGAFRSSGSGTMTAPSTAPTFILGASEATNCGSGLHFTGDMSNYQMYNTALSANQVLALYSEGIGGIPMIVQSLVGWWPLNGDANDYSGNANTGQPTGVSMNNTWAGMYTGP